MLLTIQPEEMKRVERRMTERTGTSARTLMERAAAHLARVAAPYLAEGGGLLVLCGPGNNGGDGLAAARLLMDRLPALCATVWQLAGEPTAETAAQRDRLLPYGPRVRTETLAKSAPCVPSGTACIIDALFGTGLNRPLAGAARLAVEALNAGEVPVIAVDIPSGLDGGTGHILGAGEGGIAVRATDTVTFHRPKPGLFLNDGLDLCGRVTVADIGIGAADDDAPGMAVLACGDRLLPERKRNTQKGDYGRVLVVAGSPGMAGAAALCALAALRAGAGLVTVACPAAILPIVQTLCPCATCLPLPYPPEPCYGPWMRDADTGGQLVATVADGVEIAFQGVAESAAAGMAEPSKPDGIGPAADTPSGRSPSPMNAAAGEPEARTAQTVEPAWAALLPALRQANAVVAGCGLGQGTLAQGLLNRLFDWLSENPKPAVLDADALNLLAKRGSAQLPDTVVLTPHAGEAARLLHITPGRVLADQAQAARAIRCAYGGSVVLKSAATVLVCADGEAIHPFGTAGMAKGGSGDTLAGVLAAMLAGQAAYGMTGVRLLQAGCALHGLAGLAAAQAWGERGMLATDLCAALGRVPERIADGVRCAALADTADQPPTVLAADPWRAGDRNPGVRTLSAAATAERANAGRSSTPAAYDQDTVLLYIASGEAESLSHSGTATQRTGKPAADVNPRAALGRQVRVTVDRPLGSRHPEHRDLLYALNYGYVADVLAADNEWQDAYILGVDQPVEVFEGEVVAVIHRLNDVEDKWVVAAPGSKVTEAEVRSRTDFAERYHHTEIWMAPDAGSQSAPKGNG